jgi:hypothetical protein
MGQIRAGIGLPLLKYRLDIGVPAEMAENGLASA